MMQVIEAGQSGFTHHCVLFGPSGGRDEAGGPIEILALIREGGTVLRLKVQIRETVTPKMAWVSQCWTAFLSHANPTSNTPN